VQEQRAAVDRGVEPLVGIDAQGVGAVQAAEEVTPATASSGSTAPVEVVPALATTQIGSRPAARSEAIAVLSAAGSSRRSRSTATRSTPTPMALAALATEKCVSAEA
jgi:hypothetical protein